MQRYIYQRPGWPGFIWDSKSILLPLSDARHLQGKLAGKMEALGFKLRNEAVLETLTTEVIKTSEIEGQILDLEQVRSSIARRLWIEVSGLVPSDRNVEGVVDMILDATQDYKKTLTAAILLFNEKLTSSPSLIPSSSVSASNGSVSEVL